MTTGTALLTTIGHSVGTRNQAGQPDSAAETTSRASS